MTLVCCADGFVFSELMGYVFLASWIRASWPHGFGFLRLMNIFFWFMDMFFLGLMESACLCSWICVFKDNG